MLHFHLYFVTATKEIGKFGVKLVNPFHSIDTLGVTHEISTERNVGQCITPSDLRNRAKVIAI